MQLSQETFNQLNTLFQGTMSDERARRSFVTPILFQYSDIFGNINWAGSEREFIVGLLKQLVDYGEITEGRQALLYFLESAYDSIGGVDKQTRLTEIIRKFEHQINSSNTPNPSQGIDTSHDDREKWYEGLLNKQIALTAMAVCIIAIISWLIYSSNVPPKQSSDIPKPEKVSILPFNTSESITPTTQNEPSSALLTPENLNISSPDPSEHRDLNLLYPDFPLDIVNPYRTSEGDLIHTSALILEPLANIDTDGNLVPKLAARIPSVKNGGIIEDGRAVIWKLKSDIYWSDGTPFSADDVVFTYHYCSQGVFPCRFGERFNQISKIDAIDSTTVRIEFEQPTLPFQAFVTSLSPILQKKQFLECMDEESEKCIYADAFPLGTGPYIRLDYPDDDAMSFALNDRYRDVSDVYFSRIFMQIEENRNVAARAVLESGEANYARLISYPTIPIDEKIGRFDVSYGMDVYSLVINHTNPDPTNGKESSVWYPDGSNAHPILSDRTVIKAMSAAINRNLLSRFFQPPTEPICDLILNPLSYVSSTNINCMEATTNDAQNLLKQAGWIDVDQDGVREKNGFRLNLRLLAIDHESFTEVSQRIRRAWKEIGIDTEIVQVDYREFYGYDQPALSHRFDADILLYRSWTNNILAIDRYLSNWQCSEIPTPPNWQGENIARWCNEDYDAKLAQLQRTIRSDNQAALVQEMNEMLVYRHNVIIPLVNVGYVFAYNNELDGANLNVWDVSLSNISEWRLK